ncbi:MAG: HAD-IA family hydrolase [Eubacteriales bacterium]|nr:HAD-IA family hydrolase [Eubacteriales bacterium]
MYKAALFDLDGTLTDSMNLSAQAFIHTFRKHLRREYTPAEIFAMFGPCEEGIFRKEDESQAQAMMETFLAFYRRCHKQYAAVYPGVIPVLELLKKQMPLAVITGKGKRPALITLEETGLAPYFDLVISGSCVQRHKPDPQGIEMVLHAFGVSPQQAFYLGDSPGDIKTARRAGVTALAALWGARDRESLLRQQPDAAFASPEEFAAWAQKLLK